MTTSLYLLLLAIWVQAGNESCPHDVKVVYRNLSMLCAGAAAVAFAFGK